jgi:putative ABC transport system permease protein
MFWVQDELSYDKFHKNHQNIYRLVEVWRMSDGTDYPLARTPYPLGPELKKNYPEIIESIHFNMYREYLVRYKDHIYYEKRLGFADSPFFQVFSFPLIKGNTEKVLSDLSSIVLSESMAKKYFGNEDPIGKSLTIDNKHDFTVSGVMKNVPRNSHIQFDFIANFEFLIAQGWSKDWDDHMYTTYVQLTPDTDLEAFGAKIKNFINENEYDDTRVEVSIQSLEDIHLRSHFDHDFGGFSEQRAVYVYIFSIIAVIVLLIACINFMNLATARSAIRAKEIGVRKVAGAFRNQIIKQFIGESVFVSFCALFFALILMYVFLPEFNALAGKSFNIKMLTNGPMLFSLFAITLLTGLFAGSYPAFYLSSFRPHYVLKGIVRSGRKGRAFRRTLVIIQFALSVILLMGTFVVSDQLSYLHNKNLGIKKENIIYFRNRGALHDDYNAFKFELMKHHDIESVALSSDIPLHMGGTTGVDWEGKNEDYQVSWAQMSVDYDYIKTFGLEIIQGREFSQEMSTDTKSAYIINQTGAEIIGFENPIDKKFAVWENWGNIIGVVRDFHVRSLHEKIKPVLIHMDSERYSLNYSFIKTNTDNIASVIQYIKKLYQQMNPNYPFQFHFLDAEYEAIYLSEERTAKLFAYFSIIAIFISCLGLFGLSSFITEQRTKEIGIRKILGANVSLITFRLLKDFSRWVFAAIVIAWPIGYYVMNQWLQNFAYRINFSWRILILSGAVTLLIAVATVSYRSIKAATANPVDSLRYE